MTGTMDGRVRFYVNGIGILGPGLSDWPNARDILAGRQDWTAEPVRKPVGEALPPGERRRSSTVIKLAADVAKQATDQAGTDPRDLALVFASANGDTDTVHHICDALAAPDRAVSPTRFHNSVHNAPAGYWGIATGSRQASSAISAWDESFTRGLLESAIQTVIDDVPVLFAAYDIPFPAPLSQARPVESPFATALVLTSRPISATLAELTLAVAETDPPAPTLMADPGLEALRRDNSATRALPLLAALAGNTTGRIVLENGDLPPLLVDVLPWS